MNKKSKGFTLIELLVVIAIIGILAALVLVALGSARNKAQDARIKSDISQLRTLAEVHYDANGSSYLTPGAFDTCLSTPNTTNCKGGIETSVPSLTADLDTANGAGTMTAKATGTTFCVSSPLMSVTSTIVCVDSSGATTEGTKACSTTTGLCV